MSPGTGGWDLDQGRHEPVHLDRISIEVSNRCRKGCSFCYNASSSTGDTEWTTDELVEFVQSCADGGVKAVSLGGGEPLEFAGIYDVLARLKGTLFRSLTTSGLPLDDAAYDRLSQVKPDKVHVSIHFPENAREVERVIRQVRRLSEFGIRSGVNLLVRQSQLEAAKRAADLLRDVGVDADRIVYLPMRSQDTPTPEEVARVAGDQPFQSMSCLRKCARSPRFCSISWDRRVAWCSYTRSRARIDPLTFDSLISVIASLGLEYCGDKLVSLAGA